MKTILFFLAGLISCCSNAQLLNGNFENAGSADLSYWDWTCGAASFNNAPAGGGNWSIKVYSGNLQGCFPGYAYQKIPSVTNGQMYILSGWAFAQTAPPVGLFFGKINNGTITIQAGDTTSSASWTPLNIQSAFSLSTGDTAVVILYGGVATGPVQGYGYFDLINLQLVSGISSLEHNQSSQVYPVPFNDQLTIDLKNASTAELLLYDIASRKILAQHFVKSVIISTTGLARGIYFYEIKTEGKTISKGRVMKD